MFAAFAKGDKGAIHPNIRGAVYKLALRYGGDAEVGIFSYLAFIISVCKCIRLSSLFFFFLFAVRCASE